MDKNLRIRGTVHFHPTGERIECNLPIILFQEDDTFICYCPALDLAGYGESEVESQKSFEIVLNEYFSYTLNKKTLKTDLSRLGWQFRNNWRKKMSAPDFSTSLEKNEHFKEIFNTTPFTKTNKTVQIPAFA